MMNSKYKYVMIVTEEDERYDGNNTQLDFYADNPFEGKLSDIVYGNNVNDLRISSDGHDNEGLFYVLYAMESGKRIGYGTVEFDAIVEEIAEYERQIKKTYVIRYHEHYFEDYRIEADSKEEAMKILDDKIRNGKLASPDYCDDTEYEFIKELD